MVVEKRYAVILLVIGLIFLVGCKITVVDERSGADEIIIEEIGPTPTPAGLPTAPAQPAVIPAQPAPTPIPVQVPTPAQVQPEPAAPPVATVSSTRPYQSPIGTEEPIAPRITAIKDVDAIKVHVLDVGNGESILVQSDKTMLMDCGPKTFSKKVIAYLESQAITTIDILLLTNLERSRIGGCEKVLDEFAVTRIIQNRRSSDEGAYKDLMLRAEELGIPVEKVEHDMNFTLDSNIDVQLHVPYDKGRLSDAKSYSIITRLDHGGTSFLFFSDCGQGCERIFYDNGTLNYQTTFLGLGAHANEDSGTRLLLGNLSAQVGLLSANRSLDLDQVVPSVIKGYTDLGLRLYRTDYDGDIVVHSNGRNYYVSVSKGIEHWKEGTEDGTMRTPSQDCPFVAHYSSVFYYTFDCPMAKTVEPSWRLCFVDSASASAGGRQLDSRCG